jgi:uncharacterized membrane protein YfcA
VSLLLFLAALVGGALNSVAGGGSFIALPALLHAGVSPVSANATTAMAMWPGSLASAVAYRREIAAHRRWLGLFLAASLLGGLLGGLLLVSTSDTRFMRLLPWLMLVAATTFTFGNRVLRAVPAGGRAARAASHPAWGLGLQLLIAIYGGYFGGGMGIMMLATMAMAGMTDIHQMNGLKVLLAVAINGIALVGFMAHGLIAWTPGLVMVAGGMVGGYLGATTARRIDQRYVRAAVIVIAWTLTIYFFVSPTAGA